MIYTDHPITDRPVRYSRAFHVQCLTTSYFTIILTHHRMMAITQKGSIMFRDSAHRA
jgi:hypothetical protein